MSPAAKSNEIWLYSQTSHNNINRMEKILQLMTLRIDVSPKRCNILLSWFFFQVLLKKKSYDKRW